MTTSLSAADVGDYAAVLCDLDGCLIAEARALPGAEAFAQAAGDRLSIVSNNSADTGATLSRKLGAIGLELAEERIFLAGELAVRTVAAERPGARVLVFAEPPLRHLATDLGLRQADDLAEVVVLGRDTRFTLASLERALRLLDRGAELVLTNPDLFHPNADGRPVPETGSLFAAFRACLPDLPARVFGKPEPFLIEAALRRTGVAEADAVFVGDNADTDGAAAARAGLDFIHLVANGHPTPASDHPDPPASPTEPTPIEVTSC
ncbi:HAD family hydrolase [Labrenzia sp. 011]|uniref:HAD-IIA family hydrolase n=1 Tax=Labrenzia sp. 011 TaxID=2171494 RepID=UPI000D51A11E|nr:HAD family hydrolase [Labrenzia sp. 011]PVB61402.1 haloacid dehalogenase [Labrenzia sp. 011]